MQITLITGGQRSGKSEMAEGLALSRSEAPVYLATATVNPGDAEMARRVAAHRERRGPQWSTIEEPLAPSAHAAVLEGRTVLVDCLTLWATNLFFANGDDEERAFEAFRREFELLAAIPGIDLIMVSNEIGLGGISPNPLQRRFTDLQGRVNRLAATVADEVYFMISGLPLKIK
ncbi:MAG: bifunctional adenosylcobinamide kinase/adenosylcobinamide-phosphate guanylyltransferase [Duncaniella sp.]|nr:bifunctional adenosylcobinamide kinase/adenosylcobinamide-phosphate guanylyltransferase [Duncaniella sp.]